MRVQVNQAGSDDLAGRRDDVRGIFCRQVVIQRGHPHMFDGDIRDRVNALGRINEPATLDEAVASLAQLDSTRFLGSQAQ